MTQIQRPPQLRDDEHDIAWKDTRSFAATKWTTTVSSVSFSSLELRKAREVDSHEKYLEWITKSINDCTVSQSGRLQSLQLLARPLGTFISRFEELVAPERVDMSLIWGLVYLNVKWGLSTEQKLKRVTLWLGDLKRAIGSLNLAMKNFHDENNARMDVTDVFEPLLELLTDLNKFHHQYTTDVMFGNAVPSMKAIVDGHIEEIDKVITNIRLTTDNSRAQDQRLNLQLSRNLGFRERENDHDYTAFPVQNLPNIRTRNFYGRDVSIEQVHEELGAQTEDRLRTYTIYGRRGVGKTQIALEYAHRYQSKFDAVFWIRAETSISLRESFAEMAVRLKLPGAEISKNFEENQVKVLKWLKETKRRWLLVYDNAEKHQLLKAYWPRDAFGSILLTSRTYFNFANEEERKGDTIPVFNSEERWELLMKLLGDDWSYDHLGGSSALQERQAAKQLLQKLGGLALAISQAATLIRDPRVTGDNSIVTFLRLFESHNPKLPRRQLGQRDALNNALDTVWSIAFEGLSKNARDLLGVFALLSPDAIPLDLFLPTNQARLDGVLAFCKQLDGNSAVAMSPAMQTAVDELKAATLIQQDGRNFVIHRVIQEAVNYKDYQALQQSFDAATQILHESFPIQLYGRALTKEWPRCQLYVQHVVKLCGLFVEFRKGQDDRFHPHIDFVRVLSNCGWYLFEVADYAECLKMMDIACSACTDRESLLFSHLINTIGAARYELNHLKRSRINIETALKIRQKHLEADDLQIAISLANLGNIETAEGNYDEAQELLEKAAIIRKKHNEPLMLGLTFLQLGRVWSLRGEHEHARQSYSSAESCFMRKGAEDPLFTSHVNYAYGNLELEEGFYREAVRYYMVAKDITDQIYPYHPLAASIQYKLACAEQGLRHTGRALQELEKAFNVADIRSPGEVDGTIARILWKKAEILIDDPIRKQEGLKLKQEMIQEHENVIEKLGLQFDADEQLTEAAFDILVPGYFR